MARVDHPEPPNEHFAGRGFILFIVFFSLLGSGWAAGPPATSATVDFLPQRVKAKVQALGIGAKVKVTTVFRRNQHSGLTRIDESSFEVVDVKSLTPNVFQYSAVNQVSGRQLPKPADHARKRGVMFLVSRAGFGP